MCLHVCLLEDSSGSVLFFPLCYAPSLWSKVERVRAPSAIIPTPIPLECEVHEGTDHLGLRCQCVHSTYHGARHRSRTQYTFVGIIYLLHRTENVKLCTFTQVFLVLDFSFLAIGSEAGMTNEQLRSDSLGRRAEVGILV